MKHVIIDFDNTMGVPGCDVDDGLALLYLLGKPEDVVVEGICCTYGNSDIDTVAGNTRRICRELGLHVPVFKGGASALDPTSDAARFLAEAVAKRPGEISILATGSLTNLRGAAELNPAFFSQVREIALMGGITETLLVNGRVLDELNLSCDPQASCQVLGAACPVVDATAQACLPAVFTQDRFARELGADSWLMRQAKAWFDFMTVGYWNGSTSRSTRASCRWATSNAPRTAPPRARFRFRASRIPKPSAPPASPRGNARSPATRPCRPRAFAKADNRIAE